MKHLDTLAMGLIFGICLFADALMECLGSAFLPVTFSLLGVAYLLMKLSDRMAYHH